MEVLSAAWWSALAAIVVIDLVLAGDNAIVIALAARNLPAALQRRAIFWGTLGAVLVRVLLTLVAVQLLRLPGLMALGGLALLVVAYRLLDQSEDEEDAPAHASSMGFWSAMRTIVVADALMGVDNVLGVAGAAKDSMVLVVLGLLISVPLVVFSSALVLRALDRFPLLLEAGAAVLAWTAAGMVLEDAWVHGLLRSLGDWQGAVRMSAYVLAILGVLGAARLARRNSPD